MKQGDGVMHYLNERSVTLNENSGLMRFENTRLRLGEILVMI